MSEDIRLLFCRRMMILSRSGHGHAVVRDEKKRNADKSQRRRRLCMFEGRGRVNHAWSPECGVQDRRREFTLPQVRRCPLPLMCIFASRCTPRCHDRALFIDLVVEEDGNGQVVVKRFFQPQ